MLKYASAFYKKNYGKSTVIDNIFTNNISNGIISGNLTVDISDHLPTFLLVPITKVNKPPKRTQYKRDFKNFNKTEFILDYFDIEWNNILQLEKQDPNISTENFVKTMSDLVDKHLPLKKIPNKNQVRTDKPWVTPDIIHKIKRRDKLYKAYIRKKHPHLKDEIKVKNNEIQQLTRQSKKTYYEKYFNDNKQNVEKIWDGIKQIINIKPAILNSPTCIIDKDQTITDNKNIAESFNDYFSTVAANILSKQKFEGNKSFDEYLSNPTPQSITFYDCDSLEVQCLISEMKLHKAYGPNSIPIEILKLLKNNIAVQLSSIFNISLRTGIHPEILKTSNTIPIFKNKGSKLDVNNYRPISLLSNINKLLERIVYTRVYAFLEKHKSLYKHQYGFRSTHSTNHAIVNITENIKKALDNGKFACGIFVDLQKAFDTVNHDILKRKLYHYGIRGVANSWFKSYLSNRMQYVTINGECSSPKLIEHGVPQGSVLGPLLFLIYINDLHKSIHYSTPYHFADDTNLLNINSSPKKMQKQVNIDLKLLYKWLVANKISLNCSKTELIIFKKPNKTIPYTFKIYMNGHKLEAVKCIKYLGIFIDENVNGKIHCKEVLKKLIRANGMLAKIRHYVQIKELVSIYHSIFSSHLLYGCQFWGQLPHNLTRKIFLQQKKALRIISFSDFNAHTSALFKQLNILKFDDLVSFNNCMLVYDFLTGRLPVSFSSFFKKTSQIHNIVTRNSNCTLWVPTINSVKYGLYSINRRSINDWNSFINSTLANPYFGTKSLFKASLKNYFTEQY